MMATTINDPALVASPSTSMNHNNSNPQLLMNFQPQPMNTYDMEQS